MNKSRLVVFVFCIVACVTYSLGQSVGNASYYADRFHGRRTSNGERYHRDSMTCAHRTLPFGTMLRVKNPRNGKEVIVEVTDRGPHTRKFLIDLSYAAARELDIIRYGYSPVEITVCRPAVIPYRMENDKPDIPELIIAPAPQIPLSELFKHHETHEKQKNQPLTTPKQIP